MTPLIDNATLEHSLTAEVRLQYRSHNSGEQPFIGSPEDAAEYFRKIWDQDALELCEEFIVIILNAAKRCLGWCKISRGSSTATIVCPAAVFRVALLANAHSILCAHNHPSGTLKFSAADIALTKKLIEAGKFLDISVEDHIVITFDDYLSFREQGMM